MSDVLFFSRNRCTTVEEVNQETLRSCCRLQDTATDAFVEVTVALPDLEVKEVKAEVYRSPRVPRPERVEDLKKVVGVRIAPGMAKIMKGAVGDEEDLKELLFMVEECCQAVILSFSKADLAKAPEDPKAAEEFYTKLVKENVRLYNSCIAFAPGSPLVAGMEPSKK
ncbi:MAG: hypothetical protein MUO52_07125 [Desulfobacterales bacterium]|nr:hypothetical protein [Desulfobacterales bacterium]